MVSVLEYRVGDLVYIKDFIGDDDIQVGMIVEINNRIPYFTTYKVLFDQSIIEVSEIFLTPLNNI